MADYLKVDEILKERNISTMDIAKQTGLSYNTVLQLRRSSATRVDLRVLEVVAKTLGVQVKDLFA